MKTFLLATFTAVCLTLPIMARAQDVPDAPSYAVPPPQSYADSADENIHGRVTAFDGGYNLSVQDERGFVDNIELHPGTIINPVGLTLTPGMVVSVLGYNAGEYFAANEIDTPYQFDSGVASYAGHPWNYYGPSIRLDFFFGNAGWWHGGVLAGGYRYVGSARVYNSAHVSDVYRANPGRFHGRDFVAPAEHGGYYAPANAPSAHHAASPHTRDGAH